MRGPPCAGWSPVQGWMWGPLGGGVPQNRCMGPRLASGPSRLGSVKGMRRVLLERVALDPATASS